MDIQYIKVLKVSTIVLILLALTVYFMRVISLEGGYLTPWVQTSPRSTAVDQMGVRNAVAAEKSVDKAVSQAPESKPGMHSLGQSRGYLTTPSELRSIKLKADQGV